MTAPVNPPAFPSRVGFGHDGRGMTLRDYFAGQFLSALPSNWNVGATSNADLQEVAHQVYRIADAVLAERAKDGDA